MKILIVDDNKKVRDMIRQILAGTAATFLECNNGIEALALHNAESPDCILMDIEMQPVDGITTTEMIKRSGTHAKVIVVTQYDTEDFREKARTAGADGFLSKEYLTDLPGLIRKVIGG